MTSFLPDASTAVLAVLRPGDRDVGSSPSHTLHVRSNDAHGVLLRAGPALCEPNPDGGRDAVPPAIILRDRLGLHRLDAELVEQLRHIGMTLFEDG